MDKKEIIIAAKIYPLKILYNGDERALIDKFEGLFSAFYDVEILKNVLSNAIGFEESYSLLRKAEKISFYEHIKGNENNYLNLKSVFSRVCINGDNRAQNETYYRFGTNPVDAVPIPLDEKGVQGSIENHLQKFESDLIKLSKNPPKNRRDFEISFDRILYKYLWCVASSKSEGEDISLYDHSKVMTAITSCLLHNEDSFIIGICDFSGIQKYIFSVASTNGSGVSKRLRARSFYVDLLIKTFARYVVDEFDVGTENILLETGGKFYVLLPANHESESKLSDIRDEIDQFLYNEYKGQVSVNFSWQTISDSDLENYSDVIANLTDKLREQKQQAFSGIIKNFQEKSWNEDAFILENDLKDKHLCSSCRNILINKNKDVCHACKIHFDIGEKLPKAKYFIYSRKDGNAKYRIFKDYFIEIAKEISDSNTKESYLIESLQDITEEAVSLPVKQIFMTNHVPVDEKGGVISFSDIADMSKGTRRLAALKMDVDTLGYVFSDGLKEADRHYGTISRIGTMSRLLNVFFCGKIQKILEMEKYKNVYSVFSGGDDLFLIGPWNVIPELAIDINHEFRYFTRNNELTVSAGISIFGPKEHIARMAEQSEEELEAAKNSEGLVPYPKHQGRNRVKFMGDIFSWEDFEEIKKLSEMYVGFLESGIISTNILRRLMQYSSMYREYVISGNTKVLMFAPLLNYDKNRNYPNGKNNNKDEKNCLEEKITVNDWLNKHINEFLKTENIFSNEFSKTTVELFFTRTIANWALNLSKGER